MQTRETLPIYLEAFDKAKGRLDAAGIHADPPEPQPEPGREPAAEPEIPATNARGVSASPDLDPDTIPEDTGIDPEPETKWQPAPVLDAGMLSFGFEDG